MKKYFAVQWHITDNCDLRCKHCYIYASKKVKPMETPWDKLLSTLEGILEHCKFLHREPYLYITGGDPMLHSRFWDFLEAVHDLKIPFTIMGNPYHLDKEVCDVLYSLGCQRFQLSLDGLARTHDQMRKPGSYQATLNAIPIIRNAGISCAVMSTVSAKNIADIPKLIDVVVENQVDVYAFARYCPTEGVKSNWHIKPQDYRKFLDTCWHKFEEHSHSNTTFNLKDHLWTLYLYENKLWQIPKNSDPRGIYDGCHCAQDHLTITAAGNIMACRRFNRVVGNVEGGIYDAFMSKEMDVFRHYGLFVKCKDCLLLRFCRGCPAVAYGYDRNFYARDPQCWRTVKSSV